MNEVIDISTKRPLEKPIKDYSASKELLEIVKEFNEVEGFLLCLKDNNGDIILLRNNQLDIKDRCYISQLIQSDIQDEFSESIDLEEIDE